LSKNLVAEVFDRGLAKRSLRQIVDAKVITSSLRIAIV